MPRYFSDVLHGGEDVTRDHNGIDLPDIEAAKIEALEIWKRIIRDHVAGAADPLNWHVAILDENGTSLAEIPHPSDEMTGGHRPPQKGEVTALISRTR